MSYKAEISDQEPKDARRFAAAKRAGSLLLGTAVAAGVTTLGVLTVDNLRDAPAPTDPTSYNGIKNDLLQGDQPHQEVPNTIKDEQGNLIGTP